MTVDHSSWKEAEAIDAIVQLIAPVVPRLLDDQSVRGYDPQDIP